MIICMLTTFTIIASLLSALPRGHTQPLTSGRAALSRRLDASSCEFYGYVGDDRVYNEYIVQMAGWGNDGSAETCAQGMASLVETRCATAPENFSCAQIHERLHDTRVSFRLNKAVIEQPGCVTDALRSASKVEDDEQTIRCVCLAECWATELS